ncbi:circumsporozoite protein [Sphingobium algorifonticola]|uniref:Circumsporozoite protein n=1 Tax=Sphingobium algorifonticola TaxID=2008318 RepID=A0A437J5Y5_9SPHN|nr:circumsporozoite protein [Sphingobium algorifonticola]RVT40261.1 circumsporozoite protein [Sphingobium algorifonticola]
MSKSISLSLVLAASLGLAACSGGAENTTANNAMENTMENATNAAENAMNAAENATNAAANATNAANASNAM